MSVILNIFEGAAVGYFVGKTGAYAARMTGYIDGEDFVRVSGICRTTGIGAGAVAGPVMYQLGYQAAVKDNDHHDNIGSM